MDLVRVCYGLGGQLNQRDVLMSTVTNVCGCLEGTQPDLSVNTSDGT